MPARLAQLKRPEGDKFDRTPEWLAEADRQLRVIAWLVEPAERPQVLEVDPLTIALGGRGRG